MKRNLLFCGVAALAFASCTQNEVLDVNENRAIGFDAFSGKATRAVNDITGAGGSGSTFTKFFVYGSYEKETDNYTSVFRNDAVEYTSDAWNVSKTQYWVDGKNYYFAAYSDGNAELPEGTTTFTDADGKLKIEGYTVSDKDLILAEGVSETGSTSSPTPVTLSFSHLLSKVKFTFSTTFNEDLTVTVTNLTFSPENKGTWENSEWTVAKNNTAEKTIASYVAKNVPEASEEFYVLPQSNENLKASFTVTVTDAGGSELFKKDFTDISLVSGRDNNTDTTSEWVKGYAYNYSAEITPENMEGGTTSKPIEFTPSVNPWRDGTVADTDIVNP